MFRLRILSFALLYLLGALPLSLNAQDAVDDLFGELEEEAGVKPSKPAAAASSDDDLFGELEADAGGGSDGEDDLFASIDDENSDEDSDEKESILGQIRDNFSAKLEARATYFKKRFDYQHRLDNNKGRAEAHLLMDSFFNWGELGVTMSGWLTNGTHKDVYSGVRLFDDDEDIYKRRLLEVKELYASRSYGDFDFTVGKRILSNGLSVLYSPSDRFRPADTIDPYYARDYGIIQLRTDYYVDKHTFTFALLPVPWRSKVPNENSRWGNDSSSLIYKIRNPKARNFGYFGRAKTTFKGWDLFLSGFYGPDNNRVIRSTALGPRDYVRPMVRNFSGGFSTTYKAWEFHGETHGSWADNGTDDHYINNVIGFTYTIDDFAKMLTFNQFELTVDYAHEDTLKLQYNQAYEKSSRSSRSGKNDIYVRFKAKYDDDLSFLSYGSVDFAHATSYTQLATEYKVNSRLKLKLGYEIFEGKAADSPNLPVDIATSADLSKWVNNDRAFLDLEYSF